MNTAALSAFRRGTQACFEHWAAWQGTLVTARALRECCFIDGKQTTVWQISSKDQDAETAHGTQKPVECMRRPMTNNSSPGDSIYEPFLGSGTTIVAAETCGRTCLAVELSPTYVDLAVRRWEQFTGRKAARESDGMPFSDRDATAA